MESASSGFSGLRHQRHHERSMSVDWLGGAQFAATAFGADVAEALVYAPYGQEGSGSFWGNNSTSSDFCGYYNGSTFNLPITLSIAFTKMLTSPPGQSDWCNSVPICSNTATPKCKYTPIREVGGGACHPAHYCEGLAVRVAGGPYSCFINVCIPTTDTTPSPSCTPLLQ